MSIIGAECHSCKKKGHLAQVCRKSTLGRTPQNQSKRSNQWQQQYRTTHQVEAEEDISDSSDCYQLSTIQAEAQTKPMTMTVKANNCDLKMKADTGASLSIISEVTCQSLLAAELKPPLKPTDIKLHTYTKESLQVLGSIETQVTYKKHNKCLPLLVVGGNGPSSLGRNWLTVLKLEWQELYLLNYPYNLQTVLDCHKRVFSSELGEAKGVTAKLHVSNNTKPYFCRARLVPHALKGKVEQEHE